MKNILYIGPYRQNDGWGLGSRDLVIALSKTNFNLATRPIYMCGNIETNELKEFERFEKESFDSYDIIIQHVLPSLFEWRSVKSVGTFYLETGNLQNTTWLPYLQMMDGIMVCSSHEVNTLKDAGCKNIHQIGHPIDTEKFNNNYKAIEGVPQDTFNFYFIGEFIDRKNLGDLVTAYHVAFTRSDNVNLIIKTSRSGIDEHNVANLVKNYIAEIKNKTRIYQNPSQYKPELVITKRLTDEEMCSLHKSCHCLVMPSHGEAFCRPVIDAIGFGNSVIVTDNTGMTDYIEEGVGWKIPSYKTLVKTDSIPRQEIYTGRETWYNPSILDLVGLMRKAYKLNKPDINKCKKIIEKLSYNSVAKKINEILDKI